MDRFTQRIGRRTSSHLRQALGILALTTAAALALTSCTSSGSTANSSSPAVVEPSKPITLSFWGSVPHEAEAIALWNKEHPNIQVKFHQMAGSDQQKLPTAVDAGTGPDLGYVSQHYVPDYVIHKRAVDITKYVAGTENLYTAAAWRSVSYGGSIYGVPQDTGPSGMLYRKDIFTKYGIAVPTTWDEYLSAAEKLHAANPSIYIGQFSPSEMGMFYQDVVQAGGSWYGIEDNAWTVSVDGPETQKVAATWQQLIDKKLWTTVTMWTPQYWSQVNSGKIASIMYAAWFPALLKENAKGLSGKWAVAPMPTYAGSDAAGDTGGGTVLVLKGTKYPQQAAQFATWLNSDPDSLNVLVSKGGIFPAAKAGLSLPALTAADPYYGGQRVQEVFKAAALKVPSSNQEGPGFQLLWNNLVDGFGKVASGQQKISDALKTAQSATVADLKSQGLTVK